MATTSNTMNEQHSSKTMKDVSMDSAVFEAAIAQASDVSFHAYKAKFAPSIEGKTKEGWHEFARSRDELMSVASQFIAVNCIEEDGFSVWVGILDGGNRWAWKVKPASE